MRHLDLFSGIGGFSIASDSVWSDVEHIFCDNDQFSQAILRKHWPESKIYGDIKELRGVGAVDLVTGGFPCQPFSSAGKRKGKEDDRHLWPEMLRVIRETSPRWVIGENVGGLLTWNGGMVLDEVFSDLEGEGYEVWAFVIPACALNAPHRRDRVWIIAHADRDSNGGGAGKDASSGRAQGLQERDEVGKPSEPSEVRDVTYSRREYGKSRRSEEFRQNTSIRTSQTGEIKRCGEAWNQDWPSVATRLCSLDDGLPDGSPRPKGWRNAALKGAGNAIVPQVAEMIMRHIKQIE